MTRPTTDVIRDHYAEIALELARLVGYPESDITPGVDLEAVPEVAVHPTAALLSPSLAGPAEGAGPRLPARRAAGPAASGFERMSAGHATVPMNLLV